MKNCDRTAVDIASNEASSAQVPQKSKFRLSRKFLFFTASALIFGASLGLTQSVKADAALTLTGIQSVLQGEPQALKTQQTSQISQQDAAVSALQEFAQRLGTAQPQSIKDLPQTAEANSLLEFLQQRGSGSPAPDKATSPAAASKKSRAPVDAHFVGAKTCLTCHAGATAEFEKTLMGRIGKTQKGKFECENCHGPGSAHVKAGGGRGVGGILSFGASDTRTAEEKNGICLACHERGDRTYWNGSTHQTRGLACSDCHTVMKVVSRKHQLKTAFEPDTCFQCHKDRRAQMFRSSHMPLREGKIVCSDCHNPHGSATEAMLKQNSINDNCYKCHAEKRGPFLFEHMPVRENCTHCHDPHGSVNDNMLKVSRPRLCVDCHGMGHGTAAGPAAVQSMARSCLNCHTAIHGTNHPSGALLHR